MMETGAELLVDVAVRGTVVLALTGVAVLALRRGSAATRHAVWTAGVVALLLLPVLGAVVPAWRVLPGASGGDETAAAEVLARPGDAGEVAGTAVGADADGRADGGVHPVRRGTADGATGTVGSDAAAPLPPVGLGPRTTLPLPPAGKPAALSTSRPVEARTLALLVWGAGTAFLLLGLLAGLQRVRWLARGARPVPGSRAAEVAGRLARRLGIQRPVRLLEGEDSAMPMTWGTLRPVVLIPSTARRWPAARLEAVLLHELAHVRRRDALSQLAADVACAIYWFNPLVWVAARAMRQEREHACDDHVLNAGSRPSDYARELLELARHYRTPPGAIAAVAMARPSRLGGRLRAVLDERRDRTGLSTAGRITLAGSALLVCLPLAAAAPARMAAPVPPTVDVPRGSQVQAPADPGETAGTTLSMPAGPGPGAGSATVSAMVQEPRTCMTLPNRSSNYVHNANDERRTLTFTSDDCEVRVRLDGELRMAGDFSGVAFMAPGARIKIDERGPLGRHELEVTPGAGGTPAFLYRRGGREAPFDATARAWYGAVMLQAMVRSGLGLEERVAYLLTNGGPEAVLAEATATEGDHLRGRYLLELMRQGPRTDAVTLAVLGALDDFDSDHQQGQVLRAIRTGGRLGPGTRQAFLSAAAAMDSDHQRGQVFQEALESGELSAAEVRMLLAALDDFDSDHTRGTILRAVASRYAFDDATQEAYLRAVRGMDSDHTREQVLRALLERGGMTSNTAILVLGELAGMDSDHNRGNLLRLVQERTPLTDQRVQRAWLTALAATDSDHTKGQVLDALVRQDGLPAETLAMSLVAARTIDSDHTLGQFLLTVLREHRVEGPLRDAFLKTMDGIDSSHTRGQVADALLRQGR